MVFVSYEDDAKAYSVYDPAMKQLCVTRHMVFEEHRRWDWCGGADATPTPCATFEVVYCEVRT